LNSSFPDGLNSEKYDSPPQLTNRSPFLVVWGSFPTWIRLAGPVASMYAAVTVRGSPVTRLPRRQTVCGGPGAFQVVFTPVPERVGGRLHRQCPFHPDQYRLVTRIAGAVGV